MADPVAAVTSWARPRSDVLALGLVGSRARGVARADSDFDFVLVVEDPRHYEVHDGWTAELGAERTIRVRRWGVLLERRLALPGGVQLDLGFVTRSWAEGDPPDSGTRAVVGDGLVVLHDPHTILEPLRRAWGP